MHDPRLQRIALVQKTTPSNDLVVSLQDAKDFLRVDETAEDTRIESLILAATGILENYTSQKFIASVWQCWMDGFPTKTRNDWWDGTREISIGELRAPNPEIILPIGPVRNIEKFATYDDGDNEYIVDPAVYALDSQSPRGRITLRIGQVWPTTILRGNRGILIEVLAGLSEDVNPNTLPETLKHAVLEMVAYMYENRGDQKMGLPPFIQTLVEPYKRFKASW